MVLIDNDNPKISVVVPVRNSASKIARCLHAISNQSIKPYEIIIVDGHSSDSTIEVAKRFPVTVIFEDYGTVGGARQVGTDYAHGDYIAFTDADCIPQKEWLYNLITEFDSNIVGVGGGTCNIGSGLWEESIALALDTFLGSGNSVQNRLLKKKKFVKSISGCNCMYRKKDIIAIGGYNTSLSINEDTELNLRLRKIGNLLYTPNAIVFHQQERTLGEFLNRIFLFGYSRGLNGLWDNHIIPPIIAFIIIIIAIFSISLFIIFLVVYFLIVLSYTFLLLFKTRKLKYIITLPIVFVLEHLFYSFGFWKGITSCLLLKQSNRDNKL
jgi:glycosyltransferase involved in cell wall biosynthesis